jgi:hypothetical protein
MAVQKDQAARLTYISEFIEEIKAFGLVERPAHAESRRCDWEKQLNETHRHMTGIRESAWGQKRYKPNVRCQGKTGLTRLLLLWTKDAIRQEHGILRYMTTREKSAEAVLAAAGLSEEAQEMIAEEVSSRAFRI